MLDGENGRQMMRFNVSGKTYSQKQSIVQSMFFFHQPTHSRGEGATIKRINPSQKPPNLEETRLIRGISA